MLRTDAAAVDAGSPRRRKPELRRATSERQSRHATGAVRASPLPRSRGSGLTRATVKVVAVGCDDQVLLIFGHHPPEALARADGGGASREARPADAALAGLELMRTTAPSVQPVAGRIPSEERVLQRRRQCAVISSGSPDSATQRNGPPCRGRTAAGYRPARSPGNRRRPSRPTSSAIWRMLLP